jgi:hypothetical protein
MEERRQAHPGGPGEKTRCEKAHEESRCAGEQNKASGAEENCAHKKTLKRVSKTDLYQGRTLQLTKKALSKNRTSPRTVILRGCDFFDAFSDLHSNSRPFCKYLGLRCGHGKDRE